MQKTKLLLLAAMLLGCLRVSAHVFEMDGIYYNITSSTDLTLAVTFKGSYYSEYSNEYSGIVSIPESVTYNSKTYRVTSIGDNAFYDCSSLTAITIPVSVTNIGNSAFSGCRSLLSINIPETVVSLENYVFQNCVSLKSLDIHKNVVNIGSGTFSGCSSITSIYIPKSVMSIGNNAFDGCSSLSYVYIDDCDESLSLGFGERTNYCDGLFSLCPIEKVYIGRNLSSYKSNATTYYSAFRHNASLKEVIFGNMVTSIEPYAFYECTSLEVVYIGNSLRSIGTHPDRWEYSFGLCANLKSIFLFSNDLSTVGKYTFHSSTPVIYVPNPDTYIDILNGCNVQPMIIFDSPEKEYDGKIPEFTYINNVVGMDMTINEDLIDVNAGIHNTGILVTYSNETWFTTINVPCSYTITKAPLTVIANNASRGYGEENPKFTCSYLGFKNGETESVLKVLPTISTTATIDSPQGTYPIIPYGAEATNYSFIYRDGTLTIGESQQLLQQQIVWEQDFSDVRVGEQVVLEATATSGLAVTYKVSDETILEIYTQNGNTLIDCLKEGNVTIKAYQAGNNLYAAADRVTKTITVKRKLIQQTSGYIDDSVNEYENAGAFKTDITYKRNFKNTNWQALYVPFEIPVTEDFLTEYEVAYINNVHQRDYDDDGDVDNTEIEAFKITKGTLRANYPYLIRAKEVGEKAIIVSNTTLYATKENSIDCASVFSTYTFTGTYSRLSSDVLPQSGGYYALSGGTFRLVADGTSLGAFRYYLHIVPRNGETATKIQAIRMRIMDENGNEDITHVDDSEFVHSSEEVIYDLQGRKVLHPAHGVYIVDGKKVIF